MYKLREYQEEAVKAGLRTIEQGKKEIIVAPTGAGKSIIIANLALRIGKPVLVLQPSKEILFQNYQKMLDYGYTDIAKYSASAGEKNLANITFATIGSIKNKAYLFQDIGAIIIDEAHVAGKDGMYDKLIKELKKPVIGLTATPYRMSQNYL